MQPISRTRIFIVAFVALLTIILTWPTAHYYMFLRQPEVKFTGPPPAFKTPPPPATDKIAYATWEKENPEYAKWIAQPQNQKYLAYDAQAEALRKNAIPQGLDLVGGVDVTLVIDRDKALTNEVNNYIDSLAKRLDVDKIGLTAPPTAQGTSIVLKLSNPADAQRAANSIKEVLGYRATSIPGAQALEKGQVAIELNKVELNRAIQTDLDGAKKGITDRVDKLGVTQPRISKQGEDRIRVQVPGEKDPQRLIHTVIQPAELEFRLVDTRNSEVVGSDGKVKPGAIVPPGTQLFPYKFGKVNPATHLMEYNEGQILLNNKAPLTGKDLRTRRGLHQQHGYRKPDSGLPDLQG